MDVCRVLIADDDTSVLEAYGEILAETGHDVDTARSGDETLAKVRQTAFDVVLVDLVFPPTDGVRVLEEIKRARPSTLVVLFSGMPTVDTVLSAFRKGAYDFLTKPVDVRALVDLADRAVSVRHMGEARRRMAADLEGERLRVMELTRRLSSDDPFRKVLGNSPATERLLATLREVARTDSTVLLTGESGTGKGLVARTIHEASARHDGPFVEANCVVYSEGVLHSELFGHERGAFTGAARLKRGRFELAQGGTLFLDEIGEISPATQLLLLRVLEDRTFERVGGEETLEADVRLVAATNRDLERAMASGAFRSDLYYRLKVIPVHLPPLRERRADIPVLAQHFLRCCAERMGKPVEGFTPAAISALEGHSWPGNARELENMIERLVVLTRGRHIDISDLPEGMGRGAQAAANAAGTLDELERRRILEVLGETGGNKKAAASRLGIHRSTLYAKLRRYGLFGEDEIDDEPCRDERHEVPDPATPVTSH
jgi:two-component system response regulator HydG